MRNSHAAAKIEYVWYRGQGKFVSGNLAEFEIIGMAHGQTLKVSSREAGKTIGVLAIVASDKFSYSTSLGGFLLPGEENEVANPKGWTKRLSDSQAILNAKDIIGAGKVTFRLNGKEVAWVNAQDEKDRKLRFYSGKSYFVRTVNLVPGKNVLEIFIAGERVKRVIYSR